MELRMSKFILSISSINIYGLKKISIPMGENLNQVKSFGIFGVRI